jgi:DNA-binding NtrC family response regulator
MSIDDRFESQGREVLVVDDDEDMRLITKRIFAARLPEIKLDIASNGLEAKKKIEKRAYSAIVSDVDMPEMDGLQLYEWISHNKPEYVGRMILISGGLRLQEVVDRGLPFMRKPFDVDQYAKKIRSLVYGKKA